LGTTSWFPWEAPLTWYLIYSIWRQHPHSIGIWYILRQHLYILQHPHSLGIWYFWRKHLRLFIFRPSSKSPKSLGNWHILYLLRKPHSLKG
jgi:hypothetical protein